MHVLWSQGFPLRRNRIRIYCNWSSKLTQTHFQIRQRNVFEGCKFLLIFGKSFEESVEDNLGRIECLRSAKWKQIISSVHVDLMYISALTFALGIFHEFLMNSISSDVNDTIWGVTTSLSIVAFLCKILPILKASSIERRNCDRKKTHNRFTLNFNEEWTKSHVPEWEPNRHWSVNIIFYFATHTSAQRDKWFRKKEKNWKKRWNIKAEFLKLWSAVRYSFLGVLCAVVCLKTFENLSICKFFWKIRKKFQKCSLREKNVLFNEPQAKKVEKHCI
jgi:hypothetical protein